jgi:hypothetical protein
MVAVARLTNLRCSAWPCFTMPDSFAVAGLSVFLALGCYGPGEFKRDLHSLLEFLVLSLDFPHNIAPRALGLAAQYLEGPPTYPHARSTGAHVAPAASRPNRTSPTYCAPSCGACASAKACSKRASFARISALLVALKSGMATQTEWRTVWL